jgi:hypothetical protein
MKNVSFILVTACQTFPDSCSLLVDFSLLASDNRDAPPSTPSTD